MGMRGGGQGGPNMGRGGNANASASKTQLASLVAKLDLLTHKQLSIKLTEEQQKKLQKELKGLGEKDDLSNDECGERAKAIMEVLTDDNKETLKEAGLRQPGGGGARQGGIGQLPPTLPNPFKTEENAKHLKSLQQEVDKSK